CLERSGSRLFNDRNFRFFFRFGNLFRYRSFFDRRWEFRYFWHFRSNLNFWFWRFYLLYISSWYRDLIWKLFGCLHDLDIAIALAVLCSGIYGQSGFTFLRTVGDFSASRIADGYGLGLAPLFPAIIHPL